MYSIDDIGGHLEDCTKCINQIEVASFKLGFWVGALVVAVIAIVGLLIAK